MGVKAEKLREVMDRLILVRSIEKLHLTGEQLDLLAEYDMNTKQKVRPTHYRGVELVEYKE